MEYTYWHAAAARELGHAAVGSGFARVDPAVSFGLCAGGFRQRPDPYGDGQRR